MSKTRLFVLRSPGAIGYAKLNATTGYQIVGVIRQENGRFPPLGVNVTDKATGKDVGWSRKTASFISAVFRKTVFCI